MFGKKKPDEAQLSAVPVYTVHSLSHRRYEPIQTVMVEITKVVKMPHSQIVEEIGIAGASIGADAVIGLIFNSAGMSAGTVHAFGTAIRYIDDDVL